MDWAGSAGEPRLAPGRSALRAAATPELAVTLAVEARTDEIFLTNFGPDFTNPGFEICAVCGEDIAVAQGHARRCQGQATRVALLHRFITDVLVVAFDIPATFHASMQTAPGQTIWRSVATALARAASPALQIDPDELKVGVRTWNAADPRRLGELFIYDDVPNGAGYSRQIGENLPELLRAARDLMQVCTCGTACYACLLDYRNQFWHGSLDRFAAVDALNLILDGTTPVASRQRGEHCARVLARILADLGPAQETDALGRHGVLVNGSLFITVIPSMVDPAVGTASVGSRTVRCREVSDFNVLRQPIEAIRAVRAVLP